MKRENDSVTLTAIEKRVVSEEYAKAKIEKMLQLEKIHCYFSDKNNKNGGLL